MMHTLWNLWTPIEIKLGVLFSFLWLIVEQTIGGFDDQINALVILVILDIITGMWSACKNHTFASSIASQGMMKKGAMFLIIGLGVLLDNAMHTHMIRTMFIGAFAVIEAMSLIENIDKLGYGQYIPEFIRKCLAQLADEKHMGGMMRPPMPPPPPRPPIPPKGEEGCKDDSNIKGD